MAEVRKVLSRPVPLCLTWKEKKVLVKNSLLIEGHTSKYDDFNDRYN